MATITFNIPNAKLTRLGNVLYRYGYVFDANAGTTDNQQKEAFLKQLTISKWRELTAEGEKAIAEEQYANSILGALTDVDFSDIT